MLPAIIDAPVDTHFAMHRPGSDWGGITGARTLAPYLCRHLPWYNPEYTEEEKTYYRRAGEEWTGTHSGETLLAPNGRAVHAAARGDRRGIAQPRGPLPRR